MGPLAALRRQAQACRALGSAMYGDLLGALADDWESRSARSPVSPVLAGHLHLEADDLLGLRLLGSVHRLVLERRAGELAAYYPSVGGQWEHRAGVQAFLALLEREPDAVTEWLARAPQTNEVGRASALVGGLLRLAPEHRLPVRLFEIGSSAGLNLLADRFAMGDQHGTWWGDRASPVALAGAWAGSGTTGWPDLRVVERRGSDLHPLDATTTEGRLALTAYVWPDQRDRLERLRGAFALATSDPPRVDPVDAVTFLAGIGTRPGRTTVVWHSVMWQYLPLSDQAAASARIAELGATARDDSPFVHLLLEPQPRVTGAEVEFLVVMRAWPGGERRVLGSAAPHGLPVTWEVA